MLVGLLLIGVGVVTIGWGRRLTGKPLLKVRQHATPEGRERYDGIMRRPNVERLMRMPGIVGTLAVLVCVAFVLTEL
jgi:hypothetical protein